jgi:hypothetical protein
VSMMLEAEARSPGIGAVECPFAAPGRPVEAFSAAKALQRTGIHSNASESNLGANGRAAEETPSACTEVVAHVTAELGTVQRLSEPMPGGWESLDLAHFQPISKPNRHQTISHCADMPRKCAMTFGRKAPCRRDNELEGNA